MSTQFHKRASRVSAAESLHSGTTSVTRQRVRPVIGVVPSAGVDPRLLDEAGERISSSLDYQTTLQAVADAVVPLLADVCLLDVVEANGAVARLVVAADEGPSAGALEQVRSFAPKPSSRTPEAASLASGRAIRVGDLEGALDSGAWEPAYADALRELGLRSLLSVPMLLDGRVTGVITLGLSAAWRSHDRGELAVAEQLARRAALAIERAARLQAAQKALVDRQDILSVVSHDLQNPLSTILLVSTMMLQGEGGDRPADDRRKVELIRRSAEEMGRLLSDLLDVSSLDAGRLRIERSRNSLRDLADEALELNQPLAAKKGVRLTVHPPERDEAVSLDRGRVLQVLSNLVGNAIKFTPSGGRVVVWIDVDVEGGQVRFSVSDTGPGIPAEMRGRVFDKHWRAPFTASAGLGLGLFIAKGIVEAHGGRIWADGGQSGGTTFFFTIPAE